jgi:hypothetical protein
MLRTALRRSALSLRLPAPALRQRAALFSAAATPAAAAAAASPLAALLRQLRESTGAPMVDCKAALVAEQNDLARAVDWLRKKGLSAVKKTEGRAASQGLVAFAISDAGDAGALIEVRRRGVAAAQPDIFYQPSPLFFSFCASLTHLFSLPPRAPPAAQQRN